MAGAAMKARERRRTQILDAARHWFLEHGLAGTMEEFAEELGISRRTVYRYFPTREQLVLAVQLGIIERWADVVVASTARAQGPGLARLAAVLHSIREQSEAASEEIRFTRLFEGTTFGTHPPDDETGHRFVAARERLSEHVAQILRDGIADGSIAAVVNPGVATATILNGYLALAQQVYVRADLLEPKERAFATATLDEFSRVALAGYAACVRPTAVGPVA